MLLQKIEPSFGMLNIRDKPRRPGYYDLPWKEIVHDLRTCLDTDTGFDIKRAVDQEQELENFLNNNFKGATRIFTDGIFKVNKEK